LILGPTKTYILRQIDGEIAEDTWEDDLLVEMGGWVDVNAGVVYRNGLIFSGQLILLTLGLFIIAVSVATSSFGIPANTFASAVLGLLIGAIGAIVGLLLYQRF